MVIKILDTTNKTIEGIYDISLGGFDNNVYKVYITQAEERHAGRPWILSNELYQTTDNVEMICAINGIMQPLSIYEGQLLFYPDKDSIQAITQSQQANAISVALTNFVKSANLNKQDKKDSSRLKDKSLERITEKQKTFVPPPNIVKSTESNIQFGEGEIILLPNF